jgi:hypothetical protein
MNSTDPFTPVYNPYAGLNYKQKTETYLGAFKISMPLEVMSAMLDDVLSLLNPFATGKKHAHGVISPVSSGENIVVSPPATEPILSAGGGSTRIPPEGAEYTLELGRFASPERAQMAIGFYRGERVTPELEAIREANGTILWMIRTGRFDSIKSAEAYKKYYGLTEAGIRPVAHSADLIVRYTLRLALFDTVDRARLAADFYRTEGLSVLMQPAGQGYAVITGDFESETQAQRFGRSNNLSEAVVMPFAK